MAGETVEFEKAAVVASGEDRTNERSTIAFPYADLDTAVEVARALYSRAGRGSCELDGLAAELNQTVSGAFRLKTGAAKVFGLTDKEGRDAARLTQLGIRIVSPDEERAARVEAFLSVPLYSAVFERYRGGLLPPAKALEREMVTLGVSPKVADRARQAFERSARQSGFFDSGDNRLVRPKLEQVGQGTNAPDPLPEKGRSDDVQGGEKPGFGGGGGDGGSGNPPVTQKALEYQLIDLMTEPDIVDEVKQSIWSLVQYLTARKAKQASVAKPADA